MKNSGNFIRGSILISLFLTAATIQAAANDQPGSAYQYKDDWAVVSAPPPPGPYRAVNIDPRIPGVDATPPMPVEVISSVAAGRAIPAAVLHSPPAAAGIPAYAITQDKPAEAVESGMRPTIPAPVKRTPSPPGYYYPVQPRYPVQSRNAPPGMYRNYQQQPPYGYYPPPTYPQGQQHVPPPPVYDAMSRQQPNGNLPGKGTP